MSIVPWPRGWVPAVGDGKSQVNHAKPAVGDEKSRLLMSKAVRAGSGLVVWPWSMILHTHTHTHTHTHNPFPTHTGVHPRRAAGGGRGARRLHAPGKSHLRFVLFCFALLLFFTNMMHTTGGICVYPQNDPQHDKDLCVCVSHLQAAVD